ncbi:MAG: Gfo/Idh/MocA family oxidoreductase [Clostridia bacterium]|nr:Gfo/Idh/MocA family oxidoreductase [Clostridia bacterium]
MTRVAIIGYGTRMRTVVKELLRTGQVQIVAVADPNEEGARKSAQKNGVEDCRFYSNAEEMLEKEQLDGVCIGTRCSLPTKYALLAASKKIPMFLEKPVCTTYEDLEKLKGILDWSEKTVVSFPLRLTSLVAHIKEILDSGKIGEIAHVQAYNNVHYARGYYHKWYRDEGETGGLFLQKATHDIDYINYLLGGIKPTSVCAMKSKQVFKGNKPAGLKCRDCDERESCPESPQNVQKLQDGTAPGEYCCFAVDTGNEDSGSMLVQYENGMHVVYSQNFIVRANAGGRGARLIGYLGTLEFDFRTGVVTLHHHTEKVTETYTFQDEKSSHFGGDAMLAQNFVRVMQGLEFSASTLVHGISSAEICLGARESAQTHRFVSLSPV